MTRQRYDEPLGLVRLEGEEADMGLVYASHIPHGLIASWSNDGTALAAQGANLRRRDGKVYGRCVRVLHRMVKREADDTLRLLPLHLAMEGFLALHFGGPEVAWSEYSQCALRTGLSPRFEGVAWGDEVPGLRDALRVFEIHDDQVGSLLFISDSLASAFIVSHPLDYRALHRTLLCDFFSEQMVQFGVHGTSAELRAAQPTAELRSLGELRERVRAAREEWASFHDFMAQGLLNRAVQAENLFRAGPFSLVRFTTTLERDTENHIGELIRRDDGTLEYLKTFRLSAAQIRRAFLLRALAEHEWNLAATATAQRQSKQDLVLRLQRAGFDYLLKEHVIEAARRSRR